MTCEEALLISILLNAGLGLLIIIREATHHFEEEAAAETVKLLRRELVQLIKEQTRGARQHG